MCQLSPCPEFTPNTPAPSEPFSFGRPLREYKPRRRQVETQTRNLLFDLLGAVVEPDRVVAPAYLDWLQKRIPQVLGTENSDEIQIAQRAINQLRSRDHE